MEPLSEYKHNARIAWATGDYDRMARVEGLYVTGENLVRHAEVDKGDEVLDVACGTGNVTLPAAARGARVTGLDLAAEMLAAAAKRATDAGYEIDWREGDAEALPFDDASFDVVLSSFGAMFAPRHQVVAGELARVLRPGGRLAMNNWIPGGSIGEFFATVMGFAPAMPDFVDPPLLWGDEEHVRKVFDGTGVELEFRHEGVVLGAPSISDAVELYSTNLGPVAQLRRSLEADGRWPELRDGLMAFFERHNTTGDTSLAWTADYLVVLGRKPRG